MSGKSTATNFWTMQNEQACLRKTQSARYGLFSINPAQSRLLHVQKSKVKPEIRCTANATAVTITTKMTFASAAPSDASACCWSLILFLTLDPQFRAVALDGALDTQIGSAYKACSLIFLRATSSYKLISVRSLAAIASTAIFARRTPRQSFSHVYL